MAMGSRGRREAENAIASCRPFKNSTGSFYGTRGSTRTLGWLENHNEARRIRELLGRAVYVVWSYGTPIAFVSEEESGDRTAYYVDVSHSMTTSHHQGVARVGMGEYETIWENRPARRPRRQPSSAFPPGLLEREPITSVSDQSLVGRRQPVRRDDASLVAAVGPDYGPSRGPVQPLSAPGGPVSAFTQPDTNSPDFIASDQDTQRDRLAALLDPRFANPDWTPWGPYGGLPEGADERDAERVEREGTWTP